MSQSTLQLLTILLFALPFALALAFVLTVVFRKPNRANAKAQNPADQGSTNKHLNQTPQKSDISDLRDAKLFEIQSDLASALKKAIEIDRPVLALLLSDALTEAKQDSDSLKAP